MRILGLNAIGACFLGLALLAGIPAAAAEVSSKVVNGQPGVAGDFPYLAWVTTEHTRCGGAFVSTTQVVTAAECMFLYDGTRLRDVRVGVVDGVAQPSVLVPATSVHIHPDFARYGGMYLNNIAVITLSEPVSGVIPLSIPTRSRWESLAQAGADVRAAGWGLLYSGGPGPTSDFYVANLKLIPDSVCGDPYATSTVGALTYYGLGELFDSRIMMCAGGASPAGLPVDTCQVDEGGPLVSGSTLVGIVTSNGFGCAGVDSGQPLRYLTPRVFTRLASYLDWLAAQGVGPTLLSPDAPTRVVAKLEAPGVVAITWSPPANDGGASIDLFEVQSSVDGGDWTEVVTATTSESKVVVTDLEAGRSYRFRVAAVNSAGRGEFSAPTTPLAVPAATPPGKVAAFSQSRFTKTGSTFAVTVRWRTPSVTGGSDVIGYMFRYGRQGRWTTWTTTTATSFKAVSLRPGVKYIIQVRASNAAGTGPVAAYGIQTPRAKRI